jgi:hypothetical protein
MPPVIHIFFNDLGQKLIQCVFYEVFVRVALLIGSSSGQLAQ